jgi:hypothetical protein
MKKLFALLTVACATTLFMSSCSSTEDYTVSKNVTDIVKTGNWKVNLYMDANNDQTNDFAGYAFTFADGGILKVTKNGVDVNGNWYEDAINKTLSINLGAADPILNKLNDTWGESTVKETVLAFENINAHGIEKLNITNQ